VARARCAIPTDALGFDSYSGEDVAQGVVEAATFAALDPYRAATHNKGIMNGVDAVVVADQVQERNRGVITDRVREEIGQLAFRYPSKIFAADSRQRIGLFPHVIIKPNRREAILAVRSDWQGEFTLDAARECGAELFRRNQKPVFLTAGDHGILLFTRKGCQHVLAVPVEGEIDIVGAGDSVMAGLVSALGSGAEPEEAALLGNIVASITIQQIGTTGTASPAQVRERFRTRIRRIDGFLPRK